MTEEEIVDLFRDTGALLDGHFELRSGLHSQRFFQCAKVLRFPTHAELLCKALAEKARVMLGDGQRLDAVIAPAVGGILVGHELARALGVRSIFADKENGSLALRRGFTVEAGERFIVAEDVVTRGGRIGETMDIVTARGGHVAGIAVLVDRSNDAAQFSAPMVSLLRFAPKVYSPGECPLCLQGAPLEHPGS